MGLSFANGRKPKHRARGAVAVSIAVHVGIAAVLAPALLHRRYLDPFFTATPVQEGIRERILYVAPPPRQPSPAVTSLRAAMPEERQGNRVGERSAIESARMPDAPVSPGGAASGGDPTDPGSVVLVPRSADPRIWNARAAYVAPLPSHVELLEGSLARAIARANDSVANLGVRNVRPDWVIGRDGRRFGVADDRIHLGNVELPAVALGMLPIPGFGCMPTMFFPDRPVRDSAGIVCIQLENPSLAERAERVNEMSAEIRAHAPLAIASREEIARIAARKDRERAARERARAGSGIPPNR